MINFNLNDENLGSANGSNFKTLAPNAIHNVTFKGVEFETSKTGQYEFMVTKFENEDGTFIDKTFGLKPDAGVRKKVTYNGAEFETPSDYEAFMIKVKHLVSAVAPQLLIDMQEGKVVFTPKGSTKLFQQYVEFIATQLVPYIGVNTNIKLVVNNNGYAVFPGFYAGLSKDGIVYMKTNFIGANLFFTEAEKKRIETANTARPAAMPEIASMSLGMNTVADEPIQSINMVEGLSTDAIADMAF